MRLLLAFSRGVDRVSIAVGRFVSWLTLAAVVVAALNAIVRYTDRFTGAGLSSNMMIELQWYLFAIFFLLAGPYTLVRDRHVRVDVLLSRLGRTGRWWIEVAGTVLFLLPFCALMIFVSWPSVANSWAVLEMSPDPGGLPRFPLKTVVPVAFALLALQGFAKLSRLIADRLSGTLADNPGGHDPTGI